VLEPIGEPEIRDDDVSVLVQEEVLELEVAMDNVFLMEVVYAGDELSEQLGGVLFLEVAMSEDVVEQFTAWRVEDASQVVVSRLYSTRTVNGRSSVSDSPFAKSRMMPMYFSVSITSNNLTIFGCLTF
jgi:hypothetical protein